MMSMSPVMVGVVVFAAITFAILALAAWFILSSRQGPARRVPTPGRRATAYHHGHSTVPREGGTDHPDQGAKRPDPSGSGSGHGG